MLTAANCLAGGVKRPRASDAAPAQPSAYPLVETKTHASWESDVRHARPTPTLAKQHDLRKGSGPVGSISASRTDHTEELMGHRTSASYAMADDAGHGRHHDRGAGRLAPLAASGSDRPDCFRPPRLETIEAPDDGDGGPAWTRSERDPLVQGATLLRRVEPPNRPASHVESGQEMPRCTPAPPDMREAGSHRTKRGRHAEDDAHHWRHARESVVQRHSGNGVHGHAPRMPRRLRVDDDPFSLAALERQV